MLKLFLFIFFITAFTRSFAAEVEINALERPTHSQTALSSKSIRYVNDNKIKRYIVELAEPAVLNYENKLVASFADTKLSASSVVSMKKSKKHLIKRRALQHRKKIVDEQSHVMTHIRKNHKKIKLIAQHRNVKNTMILEASDEDLAQIRLLDNVKNIYPDTPIKASLSQSRLIVNAEDTWNLQDELSQNVTGEGITVAIIDSGIDYTHASLGGCLGSSCRVKGGYDFVNLDSDPMDDYWHGTHVAGIVGGNGSGIIGIAPDVSFYAYKVLNSVGSGNISDILSAMEAALDPDDNPNTDDSVDVINFSLNASGYVSPVLIDAVQNAIDAGVIVVGSAGNVGEYGAINESFPANIADVITVGASNKTDSMFNLSSKGALNTNETPKPDLVAPGVSITSAGLINTSRSSSGTSMAAPHVTGAVALLKQRNALLTPAEIKAMLMSGSENIGYNPITQGAGRIDIYKSALLDVISLSGIINFGVIGGNTNNYQNAQSLVLQNTSSQAQSVSINLPSNLPSGVSLNFTGKAEFEALNITLNAGEKREINVYLTIADVNSLTSSTDDAGLFYGDISVSNQAQTIGIPLTFKASYSKTFKNESTTPTVIHMLGENGYEKNITLQGNQELTMEVPSTDIHIMVQYTNLSQSDINQDDTSADISTSASFVGIEYLLLPQGTVSSSDTGIELTPTSLNQFIGVNSLLDSSNNSLSLSSITTENMDITLSISDSLEFKVNLCCESELYVAIGEVANGATLTIDSFQRISSAESINNEQWYHLWYEAESSDVSSYLYQLNMKNDPSYSYDMSSGIFSSTDVDIGIFNDYSGVIMSNTIESFTLYNARNSSNTVDGTSEVVLFNNGSQINPLATSGRIAWYENTENQNEIRKYAFNNILLYSSVATPFNFQAETTFWSAELDVTSSEVSFANPNTSFYTTVISDTHQNVYSQNLNINTLWSCNNVEYSELSQTVNTQQTMSIAIPNVVCDDLALSFVFDSYLDGQLYHSKATYPVSNEANFPALFSLQFFEGSLNVSDQTVNKINSTMQLKFADTIEGVSVELRLNNQAWESIYSDVNNGEEALTMSAIKASANGNYIINADLPMFDGDAIADLKLIFTDANGNQVEHILNGAFKFGSESGEDSDVDNDGIINSQDNDNDNDGIVNSEDSFPYIPDTPQAPTQTDTDADSSGGGGGSVPVLIILFLMPFIFNKYINLK